MGFSCTWLWWRWCRSLMVSSVMSPPARLILTIYLSLLSSILTLTLRPRQLVCLMGWYRSGTILSASTIMMLRWSNSCKIQELSSLGLGIDHLWGIAGGWLTSLIRWWRIAGLRSDMREEGFWRCYCQKRACRLEAVCLRAWMRVNPWTVHPYRLWSWNVAPAIETLSWPIQPRTLHYASRY